MGTIFYHYPLSGIDDGVVIKKIVPLLLLRLFVPGRQGVRWRVPLGGRGCWEETEGIGIGGEVQFAFARAGLAEQI